MIEIPMPRLSDSMEEGTVLKWLVEDGQAVAHGQELVEIETDKATITHPAEGDGSIQIVAPEGATLPVGATIAKLLPTGAGVCANGDGPAAGEVESSSEPAPTAVEPAAVLAAAASVPPASTQPAPGGNGAAATSSAGTVVATPLARRVARVHAVALERVVGTGPRGRITQADVLSVAGLKAPSPRRAVVSAAPASTGVAAGAARASASTQGIGDARAGAELAKGQTQRIEPSRMQGLVARRMAEAKATIPHFQVQTEVEMDAVLALRGGLKQSAHGAAVPSLNDFVVKACALALREHPRANGSYSDGAFELHSRVNVGVAVAAEDALVVPVVKDADAMSLGGIARETRRLAERVRAGEISPPELSGATFTVSNLGMYGMTAIVPVINPPQAAILGVGALRETLARVAGEIVERTLMTITLSCDHRILYGADAARLLADIRALLETPLGLVL